MIFFCEISVQFVRFLILSELSQSSRYEAKLENFLLLLCKRRRWFRL